MATDRSPLDFGPCCACGAAESGIVYMLETALAPVPGTGWGCMACGLSSNGALAVVCDTCHDSRQRVRFVVVGSLTSHERAPIEEHRGAWKHNPAYHPGELV